MILNSPPGEMPAVGTFVNHSAVSNLGIARPRRAQACPWSDPRPAPHPWRPFAEPSPKPNLAVGSVKHDEDMTNSDSRIGRQHRNTPLSGKKCVKPRPMDGIYQRGPDPDEFGFKRISRSRAGCSRHERLSVKP